MRAGKWRLTEPMALPLLAAGMLLIASLCWAETTVPKHEPTKAEVDATYKLYRAEICTAAELRVTSACKERGPQDVGVRRVMLEEYCSPGMGGEVSVCDSINGWSRSLRLVFDHSTSQWIEPGGDLGKRTEFDINKLPTVALAHGERLLAVVQNTNPLLYAVTAGPIKEDNIEQLADLQKLAGLLGGNLGAVLNARNSAAGAPAVFDADITKLSSISKDLEAAQCLSDAAVRYSSNAVRFLQAIESRLAGEYELSPILCKGKAADLQAVAPAWSQLLADRRVLAGYCPDVFDALAALLAADPGKPNDVRAALSSFDVALRISKCDFMKNGDAPTLEDRLRVQHLNKIAAGLDENKPDEVKRQLDIARNQFGTNVRVMQTLIKTGGEALQSLIGGEGAVRKALAGREVFLGRVLDAMAKSPTSCGEAGAGACAASSAITSLLVVPGGPAKVKWDKVQTHPIKIAADSPLASEVIATHPASVDTSYKAESVEILAFDIGVAVTKTDLQSPVFGVAKDAAGTTRIAVTDQESRSGKFALMFNYLPLRSLLPGWPKPLTSLGLQIGAGVDNSNPAFFWGVSYGFGKYLRVGWGETSQRVKALRGQSVGDAVPDKDSIRMRQRFENDHYFSLTISIGSLRLFNAS
jgi:hypothetical protein